jgi:hypothetical protein
MNPSVTYLGGIMRRNDRICLSLLVVFFLGILFLGPAIAENYYGANSSEVMILKSANFSANASNTSESLAKAIAPIRYCFNCLPAPRLVYKGKEDRTTGGTTYTYYSLSVANRDDYPANLFKPAPDLAPCGLNTKSSRTWVSIYNQNGNYIYGFCALTSPSDMDGLWFAVAKGNAPPKGVYITLNDRACRIVLKSNLVTIT